MVHYDLTAHVDYVEVHQKKWKATRPISQNAIFARFTIRKKSYRYLSAHFGLTIFLKSIKNIEAYLIPPSAATLRVYTSSASS